MSEKLIPFPPDLIADVQDRLRQAGIPCPPIWGDDGMTEAQWQKAKDEAAQMGLSPADYWFQVVEAVYKADPNNPWFFNAKNWDKLN